MVLYGDRTGRDETLPPVSASDGNSRVSLYMTRDI